MAVEPITGLTYQEAGMLQTDVLQNELLNYFAVWANCSVLGLGTNDPPVSPSNGDRYIVGGAPTGAWATYTGWLAVFRDAWEFYEPKEGDSVIVASGDFPRYSFDGSIWVAAGAETTAVGVSYDNVTSGLAATDAQAAIDELAGEKLGDAPSDGSTYGRKDGAWAVVTGGGGSDVITVNTPTNSSGTVTLDFASKSKYIGAITLGANVTTLAFSNLPGAGKFAEYELHIKQDPTTPRTFALPASHKALGGSDTAIAAGVGVTTVLTASTVDNGTSWRYAMQESA